MNRSGLFNGWSPLVRRPDNDRTAGVTLIELIVVMTIVGIMAAIAVPRYAQATARYHLQLAANRVAADLAFARRQAKLTGTTQKFVVAANTNSYSIPNVSSMDGNFGTYVVDLSVEPYRAGIKNVSLGGDAELAFDAYGTADSDGTIVLGVGGQVVSISLNSATGQIVVSNIEALGGGMNPLPPK